MRDPETNLTYAVKYLAGAYRAANGDHNRTVAYYAGGYYYAAKRQRLEHAKHPGPELAGYAFKRGRMPAQEVPASKPVQTPARALTLPRIGLH